MKTLGAVLVGSLTLGGCAATSAAPSLDEVVDERSRTATDLWVQTAAAAEAYVQREWPEAVFTPLAFDRWVEPERYTAEVLQCMNVATGRTVGSVVRDSIVLAPRPTKEPTWALPVAHVRCSAQISPWSGLASFAGPVEQAWVRHQITVALPACVRRWGADLVIADVDAAVDASLYPTSSGRSVEPMQSVWLAAQLRNADDLTARHIRATCPDPGRTLTQLGPAEIRS
ncbi:MAG: hypothetical protein Q7J04_09805 [Microcella sp.]|nr:hypothetical protein [Microcella sp.]